MSSISKAAKRHLKNSRCERMNGKIKRFVWVKKALICLITKVSKESVSSIRQVIGTKVYIFFKVLLKSSPESKISYSGPQKQNIIFKVEQKVVVPFLTP